MTTDKPTRPPVLRLLLSPYEYQLLHEYLVGRRGIRPLETQTQKKDHPSNTHDEFQAATLRSALRVFVATVAGLEGWDMIARTWLARRASTTYVSDLFFKIWMLTGSAIVGIEKRLL